MENIDSNFVGVLFWSVILFWGVFKVNIVIYYIIKIVYLNLKNKFVFI